MRSLDSLFKEVTVFKVIHGNHLRGKKTLKMSILPLFYRAFFEVVKKPKIRNSLLRLKTT